MSKIFKSFVRMLRLLTIMKNISVAMPIFVMCAFLLLRFECAGSELIDRECLAVAQQPIDAVREWVSIFLSKVSVQAYMTYAFSLSIVGVLIVIISALNVKLEAKWSITYIFSIILSMLGELQAFYGRESTAFLLHFGSLFLGVAALLMLRGRCDGSLAKNWIAPGSHVRPPGIFEVGWVFVIFSIIACTRFYALNRLPGIWDAEACPHRAIAASWGTMIEQEIGYHIQQSPGMAWVVINHLFNRVNDPLLNLLGERLIGVGISLFNCVVVYLFIRYLRGSFAALLALIVYGFGPLDLEWSRLPTLHHLPILVGLLLSWTTFRAFTNRSWCSFVNTSLLMVVTKFVYPSAKLLSIGPILGACGVLLWDRHSWFGHKRKLIFIALGAVLFFTIRSILLSIWTGGFEFVMPVPILQPTNAGESLWTSVIASARETFGLLFEVFYGPYAATHWTVHATIAPVRSLPSICVVFVGLGFLRLLFLIRKPYSLIFIGLLVGGLIPGILTGIAERRIGFTLILLSLLAVLEVAWFLDTFLKDKLQRLNRTIKILILILVGSAMFSFQVFAFFSRAHAKPVQNMLTEHIRPLVIPGTLVVYLEEERRCEFFYGIYDKLIEYGGRAAFANEVDAVNRFSVTIKNPSPSVDIWYYQLTELKNQIELIRADRSWPRMLFIFQDTKVNQVYKDELKALYPMGNGYTQKFSDVNTHHIFIYDTDPERAQSGK